jgi:hypothetical protein
MLRLLIYFGLIAIGISMVAIDVQEGALTILLAAALSLAAVLLIRRFEDESDFLIHIYLAALGCRLLFGLILHTYDLRDFAGPDSLAYDQMGIAVSEFWRGMPVTNNIDVSLALSLRGPGWGMNYLMGGIYFITGPSILAAQSFCATIGAATVPMVYFCCERIFNNRRVAKAAAVGVAFFPAFIIWSSQLLKDGLIVFLLVAAITMVLQLQKKFSWAGVALLFIALIGTMSLRFYSFYVLAVAIGGGFAIGIQTSLKAVLQRTAVLSVVALAFIYFGFVKVASVDLETYASLDRIQFSRSAMTQSDSGYGSDVDVSTTGGAISALPMGFAYLMFAPFPWEMKNLRQTLTLPDVLLWWSMIPLCIYGLWYTIRHRLRPAIPILIFSFILTLAYSMFQGNLGAAYRQRTQIQVFLFMFIAVGWGLIMERRADRKAVEAHRRSEMIRRQRARLEHSHQV